MSKWDVFKNEESQCAFTRVDDYLSFEGQIAPTQNGSVGYCSIVSKRPGIFLFEGCLSVAANDNAIEIRARGDDIKYLLNIRCKNMFGSYDLFQTCFNVKNEGDWTTYFVPFSQLQFISDNQTLRKSLFQAGNIISVGINVASMERLSFRLDLEYLKFSEIPSDLYRKERIKRTALFRK